MVTENSRILELEQGVTTRHPSMVFVEVKSYNGKDNYKFHALATDFSDTGVALYTYLPVPVGTEIEIKMGGSVVVTGVVTNLSWDTFDDHNRIRLGVELIEINDNWLLQ